MNISYDFLTVNRSAIDYSQTLENAGKSLNLAMIILIQYWDRRGADIADING